VKYVMEINVKGILRYVLECCELAKGRGVGGGVV